MTLLLVLANSDQVVMLSDRRLSANGVVVDDESNKAAVLRTRDARLLVGFTGLATVAYWPGRPQRLPPTWEGPPPDPSSGPPPPGGFRTAFWILETLLDVAPPDHLASQIIDRFAVNASDRFERLRPAHPNKFALFCFAGYSFGDSGPKLMLRTVTNGDEGLQSGPGFRVEEAPDGLPLSSAFMSAYGAHSALDQDEMQRLGTLVSQRRPPGALIGKGVEILRAAAESPRAAGVIGKQISSAILPADPSLPAQIDYHSDVSTNTLYGISLVEARGGEHGLMIVGDPLIRFGTTTARATFPAVRVPKVGRNVPCPCHSGRKFKHCHGSIR